MQWQTSAARKPRALHTPFHTKNLCHPRVTDHNHPRHPGNPCPSPPPPLYQCQPTSTTHLTVFYILLPLFSTKFPSPTSTSLPKMLLRASSALSFISSSPDAKPSSPAAVLRGRASPMVGFMRSPVVGRKMAGVMAAAESSRVLTGVLFEPFEEVQHELSLVPSSPDKSLARQKYVDECEAAINKQINIEYNVSYVYHAMFAYFDRDNVALRGMAKFFKESSEEERDHAEKLMKYQNKRGGRVKLQSIVMPLSEFDHEEKGDALYAMELALSLERLVNEKLLDLHSVAEGCEDPQTTEFIESEFLTEQVDAIKKISEYVSQLRRVGKGHGVWHFDQMLLDEENGAA